MRWKGEVEGEGADGGGDVDIQMEWGGEGGGGRWMEARGGCRGGGVLLECKCLTRCCGDNPNIVIRALEHKL
jgi:hypothetical protein